MMTFLHLTTVVRPATVPLGEIVEGAAAFRLTDAIDPFLDATVEVEVSAPSGRAIILPCFWAGGDLMKFRYAVSEPGPHRFAFRVAAGALELTEGATGSFAGSETKTANELLQAGAPRMSADCRQALRPAATRKRPKTETRIQFARCNHSSATYPCQITRPKPIG
ncbi:MAG: hypothetical protein ACFB21_16565 [Opitutales bacterium]